MRTDIRCVLDSLSAERVARHYVATAWRFALHRLPVIGIALVITLLLIRPVLAADGTAVSSP